jgi:hypothetical protein
MYLEALPESAMAFFHTGSGAVLKVYPTVRACLSLGRIMLLRNADTEMVYLSRGRSAMDWAPRQQLSNRDNGRMLQYAMNHYRMLTTT